MNLLIMREKTEEDFILPDPIVDYIHEVLKEDFDIIKIPQYEYLPDKLEELAQKEKIKTVIIFNGAMTKRDYEYCKSNDIRTWLFAVIFTSPTEADETSIVLYDYERMQDHLFDDSNLDYKAFKDLMQDKVVSYFKIEDGEFETVPVGKHPSITHFIHQEDKND